MNATRSGLRSAALAVLFVAFGAGKAMATNTCTFATTHNRMVLNFDCWTDESITVPDGFTLDGAGHTIRALDPTGGSFHGGVIVNGGPAITVMNLTIEGALTNTTCQGGANRFRGILTTNTTRVKIAHNTLKEINRGPTSSCDEGNAIIVNPPSSGRAEVVDNDVINFQRLGIIVSGGATGTIRDNDVRTSVPVPPFGQFAIEMALGSTGVVEHNTVVTASQGHPNVAGLFVIDTQDVRVSDNSVSGTGVGVAIQASCTAGAPAITSGNQIRANRIRGADVDGILILARSNPDTICTPHADQNQVEDNKVEQDGGLTGLHVLTFPNGFAFPLTADSNVLRNNRIKGYSTPITDAGTNTTIKGNKIDP